MKPADFPKDIKPHMYRERIYEILYEMEIADRLAILGALVTTECAFAGLTKKRFKDYLKVAVEAYDFSLLQAKRAKEKENQE